MKIVVGWNGTEQGADALRLVAELAANSSAPCLVVVGPAAIS